jgi:hypothetical protein
MAVEVVVGELLPLLVVLLLLLPSFSPGRLPLPAYRYRDDGGGVLVPIRCWGIGGRREGVVSITSGMPTFFGREWRSSLVVAAEVAAEEKDCCAALVPPALIHEPARGVLVSKITGESGR